MKDWTRRAGRVGWVIDGALLLSRVNPCQLWTHRQHHSYTKEPIVQQNRRDGNICLLYSNTETILQGRCFLPQQWICKMKTSHFFLEINGQQSSKRAADAELKESFSKQAAILQIHVLWLSLANPVRKDGERNVFLQN